MRAGAGIGRLLGRRRPATGPALPDLFWVDEFIRNVRPYLFVREEDCLLIKRPNEAQKLNRTGARILKALLDGARIDEVIDAVGGEPARVGQIALFLFEVRRSLEGKLDETNRTCAVEVRPFEMPFTGLPVLSEVAVTYRCNLKCVFCYAGCNCTTNPAGDEREMSAGEIRTVLDKILRQGRVPSVSFTGGEPTLRPELPSLVRHAKGLGMRVNLITNGTRMTARLARGLAGAGLDSAQVSLEGVTAETHERITSVRGSFDRTVAAVAHLREAGVRVHTNTTLCRENLQECRLLPRFVAGRLGGDRFSMNMVIPTGSAGVNEGVELRYEELAPHLDAVAAESERAGVEFMWYSPTPLCMFNPVARGLGNKGCAACDGLLSVAANGDVLPCASYDESVGNLLREDMGMIWRSARARQHRDKFLAHPQCRDCEDFGICNGACPLYWRRIGFDELRRAKSFAPVDKEHFAQ
jgi:radical SAM protein with 4Fe4S-binding SPASM domain